MNCDNFISARPSVRVHAQPGGNSSMGSLLYGGDGAAANPQAAQQQQQGQATAAASAGAGGGLETHQGELRRSTTYMVAPDSKNELVSMIKRLRIKVKKERSCKLFELMQSLTADNVFVVYEVYENYNALMLHNRQEYTVDFEESIKNMGADIQVMQHPLKVHA